MKEENILSKLNSSRMFAALICLGIFLILLFCNLNTNLVADDYRYFFSFDDGSRIDSISDIFPSMAAHRVSMNGRVIAHALVQLFLMLPLSLFKIINSALFTLMIYLIYDISRRGSSHNALLLASVFGAVWLLQPEFGQVYLWLDGSINYLWCAVLCLLWLIPQINDFTGRKEMSVPSQYLYCIFSFIVGAYSENSTVALVFMALLFIVFKRICRHEKGALWQTVSLAFMLAGFAFMIFTPGEIGNKSADSFAALLTNFLDTFLYYLRFWPLLLLYAALFYRSCKCTLSPDMRILSLIFLGGSLAGHFVLTFALYCAGRSTYIALVLLLIADGLLFTEQFSGTFRKTLCAVCAVCLVFTLYWGYTGIKDIMKTHYKLCFNEQLISEAAANGETDVQLPRFYAETKYSAIEGLPYLNTEDPTDWPNVYMAKYYGVDSVIGY